MRRLSGLHAISATILRFLLHLSSSNPREDRADFSI